MLGEFLKACPDAVICADASGVILYWNAGAERMFGLTAAEAIGASLDVIVPEQMRGAHESGIRRLVAGGTPRVVGTVVEVTAQHKDGRFFPIEMSLSMWRDGAEPRFGAVVRDVSKRRENDERLHHLAHYDQLTLLPNRASLLEKLATELAQARSNTLLLVDIDRFKEVNDQYGHSAGDAVLCEAALRILHCGPAGSYTVARLGGDEFAVFVPNSADPFVAQGLASKIIDAFRRPFEIEGSVVWVGCSVGVAMSPVHGDDTATLFGSADLALYKAKADGGDNACFFVPTLKAASSARRHLEGELRTAWERREFELFYQPQVRLKEETVIGAEALLRWRHPERGLLQPYAFLATLEGTSLAVPVGAWIIETACRQAAVWNERIKGFQIGVNLFGAQLKNKPLAAVVQQSLTSSGLPPSQLELEVTENIMLLEDVGSKVQLQAIRKMNVGLAFDDYGTGYASLAFLKQFPITRLKIDRDFVSNLHADAKDAAIVRAIIMLSRRFGFSVIAEGVEREEQALLLRKWGCPAAQGYLYGKPVSADEFALRFIPMAQERRVRR